MHPYAYSRRSDRLSKSNTAALYTAPEWDDDIKTFESPDKEAPSPASSSSSYSGGPSRRRSKNTVHRIPRPPNAFMIFRSHFWKEQKATSVERDHREISRTCGIMWKALPAEEQERYKHLARLEKDRHMLKYPDYKYAPASRAGKAQHRKAKKGSEAEEVRCQLLAAMIMHGAHGDELEGAARSIDGCSQSPIPRPLTPVPYELRRSTPSSDSSTSPPFISPPAQEPQFVNSPDTYIATEHIPPLDLNASAFSVENAFTSHAPMMTSSFDPLLSQMYFNQEAHDPSYVWYATSGNFFQQPAVETPSYSYESFDAVHAPQASYSAQMFTTDGYYYEGGGYTTYSGWAQDTPSSYGYPSEFEQVPPEPAFPFPYTHVPSPTSGTL